MKKFKVGDKVKLIDKELKYAGLNYRVKEGKVTKISEVPTLIYVKRGKMKTQPWHTDFWRKVR